MCFSHYFISKEIVKQKSILSCPGDLQVNGKKTHCSIQTKKLTEQRQKVIRILVVITIVFFVLWTPFIVVRLLKYFSVEVHSLLWRGTQLLVFGNTAVNCFIYALMSPAFREAFKGIFYCRQRIQNNTFSTSRSIDVSETVKRQSSINHKVVLKV